MWIACLQPRADWNGRTSPDRRQHGTEIAWRKLHIAIDAGNGEIVAFDGVDGPTPTAS